LGIDSKDDIVAFHSFSESNEEAAVSVMNNNHIERLENVIKGNMAMKRIFLGFCINRFHMSPLQYLSSRSDFDFEFADIFVIEKRLPDLPSRRVALFSNF
jgi:hypothetical protein